MKNQENNDKDIFIIDSNKQIGYSLFDFYYDELIKYNIDIRLNGYYIVGDYILKENNVVAHSKKAADLLRAYRRDSRIKDIGYITFDDSYVDFINHKKPDTYEIDLTNAFDKYSIMDFYYNELMKYGVDITLNGYHIVEDNIVKDGEIVVSDERAADLLRSFRRSEDIKKMGYILVNEDAKLNIVRTKYDNSIIDNSENIYDFYYKMLIVQGIDINTPGYHIMGDYIIKNNKIVNKNPFVTDLLRNYRRDRRIRTKKNNTK